MDLSQRIIRTSIDWSAVDLHLADYLAGRFTYRSREEWCDRIASGEITLNNRIVDPETVLQLHDQVEYRPQDIAEPPADLNYQTVFEDDKLLVINKPGNLCMHPAGPFFKHTLWHLLCSKYGAIHFVNRLDRETSGLLLAAKSPDAARKIAENDAVSNKSYLAIVHGCFTGNIDASGFLVSANSLVRKKRRFIKDNPENLPGETSITYLSPEKSGENFSLVRAVLGTGRTHQIRATLYSLGFPLVGDKLYGVNENFFLKQKSEDFTPEELAQLILKRQALHAESFTLLHPATGEKMHFSAPLPGELQSFVNKNM